MKHLLFFLVLCSVTEPGNALKLYHPRRRSYCRLSMAASLDKVETSRLQRARLRLAEAQGIVPIGSSEDPNFPVKDYKSMPSLSRVREIGWRVAEPSIQYNPEQLSSRFFSRPLVWLVRNVEFLLPFTGFTISIIFDLLMNEEPKRRKQRAEELLDIIRLGLT